MLSEEDSTCTCTPYDFRLDEFFKGVEKTGEFSEECDGCGFCGSGRSRVFISALRGVVEEEGGGTVRTSAWDYEGITFG